MSTTREARCGRREIIGVMLAAAIVAGAAGCRRGDANAEPAAIESVVIGPENIVVVTDQQIRTGPALSGSLAPEREATVRSELSAPVVQTLIDQGQRVNAGQLLMRLDDTAIRDQALSARSAVTTAQANLTVAQREVERNETLLKAGAIAERAAEQSRAQLTAAQAQLATAQAQAASAEKALSNTRITAPFSGIVSARSVNAGDVVSPGTALVTIVDPSTMRLEASVPAEALSAVRVGAPVDFSVTGYPNRHFTGHVTRVNPIADPATRQVRIIASLPNTGGTLVGGLFAEGRVSSESRQAPVVPQSAVDERGLRPSVMKLKNGRTDKTEVSLGLRDAATETVEITQGVAAGDTVLLGAARGISAGTPIRVSAPNDVKK
ncbi:MAG TPA: efflux RND transporter periplasmic adaptor subunit [Gemmatimonadaceae bacterium]|nr:efflux RND transporter periplasmic adaptor subunit [Gemmatimonadaceae bacterium]